MLIGLVWFTFLPLENWAEKGLDISFIISCLSGEGGWSEYGESMNKKKKSVAMTCASQRQGCKALQVWIGRRQWGLLGDRGTVYLGLLTPWLEDASCCGHRGRAGRERGQREGRGWGEWVRC